MFLNHLRMQLEIIGVLNFLFTAYFAYDRTRKYVSTPTKAQLSSLYYNSKVLCRKVIPVTNWKYLPILRLGKRTCYKNKSVFDTISFY